MPFPAPGHDHRACVATAIATAEAECRRRGARLTDIRRRVLELVWTSHAPIGAYGVLDALAREGRPAAPPTVYRALDFLLAHGLVHRIEKLNAFVGCSHPDGGHAGMFLLCRGCGAADEVDDSPIALAVAEAARTQGFTLETLTIEAEGLCPACARAQAP